MEGAVAGTCEEVWEDTGIPARPDCYVEATCPEGASCEAIVEFELLSTSNTSVTVEWIVYADVMGPIGCFRDPDKVDVSLELELLD